MSLARPSSSLIITAPWRAAAASKADQLPYNYRILMAKRVGGGSFENAYVFPGGLEESSDSQWTTSSHKVCAIRETFEETGILLTSPTTTAPKNTDFASLCANRTLPDIRQIGRWVTPREQKKRFDTRFFLLSIKETDTQLLDQIKSAAVQESELVRLDWFTPAEILQANLAATLPLFPPQFYIVRELSRWRRWQDLAHDPLDLGDTDKPIEPLLLKHQEGMVSLFPGDKAYPESTTERSPSASLDDCDGPLHRIVMKRAKTGGFVECRLLKQLPSDPAPKL
ncbi:hypothetical protein FBU59_000531 [Linderina macrospora]|uniref:Uncharacterized protein n=1 Tax=Linderina macrospora TaxID=4868 RepID=A0ACC1JGC5_9FUNG|nr:hypothetical protein FBU59_000531 [Linderina macrospora]